MGATSLEEETETERRLKAKRKRRKKLGRRRRRRRERERVPLLPLSSVLMKLPDPSAEVRKGGRALGGGG